MQLLMHKNGAPCIVFANLERECDILCAWVLDAHVNADDDYAGDDLQSHCLNNSKDIDVARCMDRACVSSNISSISTKPSQMSTNKPF